MFLSLFDYFKYILSLFLLIYIWVSSGEWGSIRTGCSGIGLYLAVAPIHVPSSSRFCSGNPGGCINVLLSLLETCWSWP